MTATTKAARQATEIARLAREGRQYRATLEAIRDMAANIDDAKSLAALALSTRRDAA